MCIVQINPENYSVYRIFYFFIEAFGTTPKFCNADCFPQNSKHVFGNKAAALKRWWDSLRNKKILISRTFFFFFFSPWPNLGHDLGLRKIWLIVLFFLLSVQNLALFLHKPYMCWLRILYPKPFQLPSFGPHEAKLTGLKLF